MSMRLLTASLLATLALGSASCNRVWPGGHEVSGDGNIVTDARPVAQFHDVDFEGSYDVILTQDSGSSVRIETDKNLLSYVKTEVSDGKLTVKTEGNVHPSKRMKVYVSSPTYHAVDMAGAADIKATTPINSDELHLGVAGSGSYDLEVHARKLETNVAGSGKISLRGNATEHDVTIAGSGDLAAMDLPAEETNIEISGSGDANVMVSRTLNAQISGSGNIRYKGSASEVHTSVSGSGKIEKVN